MGYMRNHAIVVSSWQTEGIEAAHAAAKDIFGKQREPFGATFDGLVSPIIDGTTNGVRSFFIAPDGSKEWWKASDDGDACRAEFVSWLRAAQARSLWLEWVEVQFGDDDHMTMIVNHSDDGLDAGAPVQPTRRRRMMARQARYVVRKSDGIGGPPIPEDEPVLVIRAQDRLAMGVITGYLETYRSLAGADPKVIEELEAHRDHLAEWQREHGYKTADR